MCGMWGDVWDVGQCVRHRVMCGMWGDVWDVQQAPGSVPASGPVLSSDQESPGGV